MNQVMEEDHVYTYEIENRSIEKLLVSIVYQNELIIKKLTNTVDREILKSYYDHYSRISEIKKAYKKLEKTIN